MKFGLRSVDTTRPSAGRMVNYLLGGFYNLDVDRKAAAQVLQVDPDYRELVRAQRRFLQRAVVFLAGECGLDRFLDLGSGLPTMGNVHQVAQSINPEARVLYSDLDTMTVAYAQAILGEDERVKYLEADVRQVETLLTSPEATALFGDERRVGIIAIGLFFYLADEALQGTLASLFEWAAPNSYLVFSDGTENLSVEALEQASRLGFDLYPRTEARFRELSAGWELLDDRFAPGLYWRLSAGSREWNDEIAARYRCGILRRAGQ